MPSLLTDAPILLTLLLTNQNNNSNKGSSSDVPIAGTVVVHESIVEANWLYDKAKQAQDGRILRLRADSADAKALTQAQCEFYNRNGYLTFPNALSGDEAAILLKEARGVMQHISEGGEGITCHDGLNSGGKVPSPSGRVLATFESVDSVPSNSPKRPIARLGCGIHQNLPSFRQVTHSKLHRSVAESLGYSKPCITQSQIITKLAHTGGRIVPHQDGCVSFTNPPSGLTFWYALEDATLKNGCLCVATGSHLTEPLRRRMVTSGEAGIPRFEDLSKPLWARGVEEGGKEIDSAVFGEHQKREYHYTPLEVKKGTLIIFNGNLMHTSGPNESDQDRVAYMFSIVDGTLECPDDTYMKASVSL